MEEFGEAFDQIKSLVAASEDLQDRPSDAEPSSTESGKQSP